MKNLAPLLLLFLIPVRGFCETSTIDYDAKAIELRPFMVSFASDSQRKLSVDEVAAFGDDVYQNTNELVLMPPGTEMWSKIRVDNFRGLDEAVIYQASLVNEFEVFQKRQSSWQSLQVFMEGPGLHLAYQIDLEPGVNEFLIRTIASNVILLNPRMAPAEILIEEQHVFTVVVFFIFGMFFTEIFLFLANVRFRFVGFSYLFLWKTLSNCFYLLCLSGLFLYSFGEQGYFVAGFKNAFFLSMLFAAVIIAELFVYIINLDKGGAYLSTPSNYLWFLNISLWCMRLSTLATAVCLYLFEELFLSSLGILSVFFPLVLLYSTFILFRYKYNYRSIAYYFFAITFIGALVLVITPIIFASKSTNHDLIMSAIGSSSQLIISFYLITKHLRSLKELHLSRESEINAAKNDHNKIRNKLTLEPMGFTVDLISQHTRLDTTWFITRETGDKKFGMMAYISASLNGVPEKILLSHVSGSLIGMWSRISTLSSEQKLQQLTEEVRGFYKSNFAVVRRSQALVSCTIIFSTESATILVYQFGDAGPYLCRGGRKTQIQGEMPALGDYAYFEPWASQIPMGQGDSLVFFPSTSKAMHEKLLGRIDFPKSLAPIPKQRLHDLCFYILKS